MSWQPAALLFPDAEAVVCQGLRPLLVAQGETDVHVDRRIPNPRTPRMVVVNRDGGALGEMRDQPRIRLRVWDATDEAAADLSALVVALMPKLAGNGTVLRVEHLSGPYDVTDESGKPQRYLLYEIHTRPTSQIA